MNKAKKNNVVNFPSNLTEGEREVEAILWKMYFAEFYER